MIRLEQGATQAFLAAGIAHTGCDIHKATGLYVAISNSSGVVIYEDLGEHFILYRLSLLENQELIIVSLKLILSCNPCTIIY